MQPHSACRERLIECVAEGLQEVRFKNQYLLDYSSFRSLDKCSLVPPRDIQDLANIWISPDPLKDFSFGFVGDNRTELLNGLTEGDFPVRLPDITDTAQMATQIVDSFFTLPWEYTVVLPFVRTAGLDFRFKQVSLSRELCIKKSSELRLPFPERPELGPFAKLLDPVTDWSADTLYLEATLKGYIGFGSDRETLERFYQQARAVAGIGLAVNAFKRNLALSSMALPYEQPFFTKPLYIYRTDEGSEVKGRTRYIPDRIGPLEQLELHTKNFDKILLLPAAFGESDECGRLREAGQWHFASMTEKSEIFEFVEAVVVLEILFNDEATARELGVERLIANRCAYLVAGSTTERQKIIRNFTAVYEARSSIVHKGKSRLSREERDLLIEAKLLGSWSIRKELEMIFASQLVQKVKADALATFNPNLSE